MNKTVVLPVVFYDVKRGLSSGERTYIEGCVNIGIRKLNIPYVKTCQPAFGVLT
jgi:hypothetical protein